MTIQNVAFAILLLSVVFCVVLQRRCNDAKRRKAIQMWITLAILVSGGIAAMIDAYLGNY